MSKAEVLAELRAELLRCGVADSDMESAVGAARLAVWMGLASDIPTAASCAVALLERKRNV